MNPSSKLRKQKAPMSSRDAGRGTIISVRLRVPYKGKEQPHEALVNLRDEPAAIKAFTDRYESTDQDPGLLRSDTFAVVVRDWFRKAWTGDEEGMKWVQEKLNRQSYAIAVENRQVTMNPKSLFGTMSLLFMRDYAAGKTAVCANPDCHSPYFIKKRKTQIYCTSGPCTDQAQREQKRLWWERNHGKGSK